MSNPLVSIIIPCYNQARFLQEALKSVLMQTYTNWECIIINDGSPDNTDKIAEKWLEKDKRFKYLFQENSGLSNARNAGLRIASGHYIQFLDSDDLIEPEKIKTQIKALISDQDIDISISGYRYFEDSTIGLKAMGQNNFLPEVVLHKNDIDTREVLNVKNPMVINAPLYRLNVFKKVGVFDEELISLEDWDFHTRCALHGMKFQHIGIGDNTKALVRLHTESMMRNKEIMNLGTSLFLKKRNQDPLYLQYFPENKRVIRNGRLKYYKSLIKLFVPPIILMFKRKLF